MKNENESRSTIDDIVFEQRNQGYGAFTLRKGYKKNMTIATIIGMCIFIVVAVASALDLGKTEETKKAITKVVSLADLAPPPPIEKTPPPPQFKLPPPPKEAIKFVAPKVTDKVVPEDQKMATIEEVKKAPVISTQTIDLPDDGEIIFEEAPQEITTKSGADENKIYQAVEQNPEFPGGQAALYEFLGNEVEYPRAARIANLEGTVIVSFVVSKTGDISGIKIIQSPNKAFNEEVIRLMKLMPNWNPGKQNGKAVNVRFSIPVVFHLRG